jgi:hypothetical protein
MEGRLTTDNPFASRLTKPVATRIVSDLNAMTSGEGVSPTQVQIVCSRLWQAYASKKSAIGEEEYDSLQGVKGILEGFLESELNTIQPAQLRPVAVTIFGNLITTLGTRDVVSRDKLRELVGSRASGKEFSETLQLLERRRLINTTFERRTYFYEVASEYLISAIQKEWQKLALEQERQLAAKAELLAEQERKRAEEQTRLAETERQLSVKANLLAEENARRAEAERRAADQQRMRAEAEALLARKAEALAEQEKVRAQERSRAAGRLGRLLLALTVAFAVAVAAAIIAVAEWQRALASERRAQASEEQAQYAAREAYLAEARLKEALAAEAALKGQERLADQLRAEAHSSLQQANASAQDADRVRQQASQLFTAQQEAEQRAAKAEKDRDEALETAKQDREEIGRLTQQITDLNQQVAGLKGQPGTPTAANPPPPVNSNRVEQPEQGVVKFGQSRYLTPERTRRMRDSFTAFANYLSNIGFKLPSNAPLVEIDDGDKASTSYDPRDDEIGIGSHLIDKPQEAYWAYAEHVLASNAAPGSDHYLVELLSHYYAGSFTGQPSYDKLYPQHGHHPRYDWVALASAVRAVVGKDAADRLLAYALSSAGRRGNQDIDTYLEQTLLQSSRQFDGGRYQKSVEGVLNKHRPKF